MDFLIYIYVCIYVKNISCCSSYTSSLLSWVEDMSWRGSQEPGVSLPGRAGPPVPLVSPVENIQEAAPVSKVSQPSPVVIVVRLW